MTSLRHRITQFFNQKSFAHGVHPPDYKDQTNHIPIKRFPFAPLLHVSFHQHIGKPALPLVRPGQDVVRGEKIAAADGWSSVPVHAPVSGVVKRLGWIAKANGGMAPGCFIQAFPGSTQEVLPGTPCDLDAKPEEIIRAIQDAGIVGLGGAAFPTHLKISLPKGHFIDVLIINGVECEPYLTTDHRVMLEQTSDIFMGIRYLLRATGAKRAVIGVEANKRDAAAHLLQQLPADIDVAVQLLTVKYPQGAEKMLVKALLDREVPSHGHSSDAHTLCINVATAAEIGRLLPLGRGIQERVITIAGSAVGKPGNYRIPIGTPVRFAMETVAAADNASEVILGGPMMGHALANLDVPINKGSSGFVVFGEADIATMAKRYPCIHCGHCVDACPLGLIPSELGLLAKNESYEIMVDEFHLIDCFECGACSYVCPSHIPLVQYFRLAKIMYKTQQQSKLHKESA